MKSLTRIFALLLASAHAVEAAAPTRETTTFDGITFEYSPRREPLVRELPLRVAEIQRESANAPSPAPAAPTPFSTEDLRAKRSDYLARIAASIGLEKPTPLQEECYDAFLENFERTDRLFAFLAARIRESTDVRRIAVWDKDELIERLKHGDAVPGFTLDPDGVHVNFDWSGNWTGQNEEIARLFREREQRRLDYGYNLAVKDDVVTLSGSFSPRARKANPSPLPAPTPTRAQPGPQSADLFLPAVITPDKSALPLPELAAGLAKFVRGFNGWARQLSTSTFQKPSALALLIFHETTEVGLVERYIGSRDRRWLCDGVANYVAWKVARDCAGADAAREIYDLTAQLARYADLRSKIDLERWPAVENQRKEEKDTPLNLAHYAWATRAIFLMAERHGEAFLPTLLRDIGTTPRAKTSLRTVEKSYRKLAREDISKLFSVALQPPP